jgi:hypothetical protein
LDILPQNKQCSRSERLFVLYLAQDWEIQRSGDKSTIKDIIDAFIKRSRLKNIAAL